MNPFVVAVLGQPEPSCSTDRATCWVRQVIEESFQMYPDAVTLLALHENDFASTLFQEKPNTWKGLQLLVNKSQKPVPVFSKAVRMISTTEDQKLEMAQNLCHHFICFPGASHSSWSGWIVHYSTEAFVPSPVPAAALQHPCWTSLDRLSVHALTSS